jgi:predicted lipoprotein with Yx(FWY)xxD motif
MFATRAPSARHPGSVACLAVLAALVAAGCGGNDGAGASRGGGGSASAKTVAVRDTGLGNILVGGNGRTLYLFEKDKASRSTCSGACAKEWPPLTASGKPTGGPDTDASLLGTTRRRGGEAQVTYNGHPLYYYAEDRKPGDTKGQDIERFGAEWYALSPQGAKVEGSGDGKDSGSGGVKPYSNY